MARTWLARYETPGAFPPSVADQAHCVALALPTPRLRAENYEKYILVNFARIHGLKTG